MNIISNQKKPLCFFDIESTGADVALDRIIQIAVKKWMPDGSKSEVNYLVNPGCKILNSHIHGITDEMVKDKPSFRDIAPALWEFMQDTDFAGYNICRFDVPILHQEFYRNKVQVNFTMIRFIDVFSIFCNLYPRSLGDAYKKYTGQELLNAHDAMNDVNATEAVFVGMIQQEPLSNDLSELYKFAMKGESRVDYAGKFIRNADNKVVFNFGPKRGQDVMDDDSLGLLGWMCGKDFTYDTKQWCEHFMDLHEHPEKQTADDEESV